MLTSQPLESNEIAMGTVVMTLCARLGTETSSFFVVTMTFITSFDYQYKYHLIVKDSYLLFFDHLSSQF